MSLPKARASSCRAAAYPSALSLGLCVFVGCGLVSAIRSDAVSFWTLQGSQSGARPEVEAGGELGAVDVVADEVEAGVPDVPLVLQHGGVDVGSHSGIWVDGDEVLAVRGGVVEVAAHLGVHVVLGVGRHGERQPSEGHDGALAGAAPCDLVHADEGDVRLRDAVIVELDEHGYIEFDPEEFS